MILLWFLILFHPSKQDCEVLHGDQYGNNLMVSHAYNSQIIEYESICRKSAIRTVCINKTFVSNVWTCKKSAFYGEVCSYETEPRSWDSKCDLTKFYELLPKWLNGTWEHTYWFPAKRFMGYGPYEYASWGSKFGTTIKDNIKISTENVENIFEKDCLIQDSVTKVIVPEYCNALHRHTCYFSKNEQIEFCSSNCASCTPSYTCVTNISTEYCTNEDAYPISLSLEKKYPEVFKDNFCSVCFKRFDYCPDNVKMVLTFNEFNNRRLYLAIYSPECLSGKGHSDYIYCFTDASEQLKKRVDVKVDFIHMSEPFPGKKNYIVYKISLEDYMGSYWCEANGPILNRHNYNSNTVIAYKIKKGSEFAVRLKINDICNFTDCSSINDLDFIIDDIRHPLEDNGFSKIRLMKILEFYNESFADILIHVSTLSQKPGILNDYYKLLDLLRDLPNYIDYIYCKSSDRCLSETYGNLTWPFAKQFQTVLPLELCIQSNGLPVTRFCEGDFLFGLNWQHVNGQCSETGHFNEDTKMLQSFLNQSISKDVMNTVSEIVHHGNLSLMDLYFVSQILNKISDGQIVINSSLFNASLDVVNGLLEKHIDTLSDAQAKLNLTDTYLRATEIAAINLTQTFSNLLTLQKDHVLVHFFNPILQNASGFALYKNLTIKNIPLKGNFSDLQDVHNIKLALLISIMDIDMIISQNLTNVSIVAVIYLNDFLFPCNTSSTADLVVNLNIPNYETYLQSPVSLLVNYNLNSSAKFNCAFWDYGEINHEKKGNWSELGSTYDGNFNNDSNLQICSYSHLTHLALLVTDEYNSTLNNTTDHLLTLITAIGSLFSIVGIFGIFLTALMFRSWRDKTGTQILMHLSIATLLEIIFMYLNGAKLFDCEIAGCILQYVVISKFAWMLIYAFCQYLRFVRVFGPMPNRLVLKSIIFGWGFGIIPVLSVMLVNPLTYYNETFCYPNGRSLYFGVYLPVALVLMVNLFIFCKIMYEITNNKFDKVHSASLKLQQIKLAILLFSVLGIPWIFGLLSNLIPVDWLKSIFLYIFTTTSIIQGFLMFLFYVVFNKETRELWARALFHEKKAYEMFSSKKSQSVTSVS